MLVGLARALLLCGLVSRGVAQDQTIVYPTTAAPSATVVANWNGYSYAGCWNETVGVANAGGVRALSNGNSSANNTMTINSCLSYCSDASMQYAGLEYGRECYCAPYLSPLSEKLNASARCIYACDGNSSEICGGRLALTLYNRTSSSETGVAWSLNTGSAFWYGFAGIVSLGIAAIL